MVRSAGFKILRNAGVKMADGTDLLGETLEYQPRAQPAIPELSYTPPMQRYLISR